MEGEIRVQATRKVGKDHQKKTDGWIKGFTYKQSWKLLLVGYGMHFQRGLLYWNTESTCKATYCDQDNSL